MPVAPTTTTPDGHLLAAFRGGDQRAFDILHDRYRPWVRARAQHLTRGTTVDPDDVAQEVFVRAYRRSPQLAGQDELGPWLNVVTRNCSLDARRRARHVTNPLFEESATVDQSDAVAARERVREIIAEMQRLPERQRHALAQSALAGRGQDEIAADLGISSGNVRVLVHRARTTLKAACA